MVILPSALIEDLIFGVAVDADAVSFSFLKLAFIFLLIFIYHFSVAHLILLEFALEPSSLVELVTPDHLFIVPPRSAELVPVGVQVEAFSITFAILYAAFVVLPIGKSNACVALH